MKLKNKIKIYFIKYILYEIISRYNILIKNNKVYFIKIVLYNIFGINLNKINIFKLFLNIIKK